MPSQLSYSLKKSKYFVIADKIVGEFKGDNLYLSVGREKVIIYGDGRICCSCKNYCINGKFGAYCSHMFAAVWKSIELTKDIRKI